MAFERVGPAGVQGAEQEATGQQQPVELTRQDLNRMAIRSFFLQASFNYERMQAGGWLYSLLPALKKIYTTREELAAAMKRHLEFFNTHPFLVTPILGIVAAMERSRERPETIRGIKVAMMGPLGGVGDAVAWLTLLPITAGIGASIAQQGNVVGPILILLVFNAVHLFLRFAGVHYGYRLGVSAIQQMKAATQAIARAASIVGMTVVGGLIASYIKLSTTATIPIGNGISVQKDILDKIMPNLLPLGYTFFLYWLLRKGYSPVALIVLTLIIGVAGHYLGVL